mgnify:CR=1 FL=1
MLLDVGANADGGKEVQQPLGQRVEVQRVQVDRHLKEGHREARKQRRLRRDRRKVGVEEVELLLAQLNRPLLDGASQQELVGG